MLFAQETKNEELIQAIRNNDLSGVKNIIANGGDVNALSDIPGETILMSALRQKRGNEVAKWLIQQEADVNFQTSKGLTPLAIAVMKNKKEIVPLLIQKGAEINVPLQPPIFWCADVETLKLLIDAGAEVNVRRVNAYSDENALSYHARHRHSEIVLELLKHDADLSDSEVILTCGNEVIKEMIRQGVNPNKQNKVGQTTLFQVNACYYRDCDSAIQQMKLLLQLGTDPNIQDYRGETALIETVKSKGEAVFVEILLQYGADIQIEDKSGKTAIDYAREIIEKEQSTLRLLELARLEKYQRWTNEIDKNLSRGYAYLDLFQVQYKKSPEYQQLTDAERDRRIRKISAKFNELKGKIRLDEFQMLMYALFDPPSSVVGMVVDPFKPHEEYTIEDVKVWFGEPDYQGEFKRQEAALYFIGKRQKYYFHGMFTLEGNRVKMACIIPLEEEYN